MRLYLALYLFVLSLPLGALTFARLHELTGGRWGAIRAGSWARLVPWFAAGFLPVLLVDYPWLHPGDDPILLHRAWLFTPTLFATRAALYFLAWTALAWVRWPAPALVGHLTVTSLMAADWVMSLDPHFASSIFGLQVLALQATIALSFLCLRRYDPETSYDLGGMLLACVMLNAYLNFSQLVVVWAGDLPSQDPYYLARLWGPWGFVAALLFLGGMALPFLCLIWGGLKRRGLPWVAWLVLAMGLVQWLWLVVPRG